MFGDFSLSSTLWAFLYAGLAFIIYKFYINPYISLLYYKKQGVGTIFQWTTISYFKNYNNAIKKGDFYYQYNQYLKKHPETKMLAENFGTDVGITLTDPEVIKEYLKRYETYPKATEIFGLLNELAAGSIVFAEGNAWKKRRKIVSTAFNFEFLKHVVPVIVEATQEKFKEWEEAGKLTNMNLVEELATITGEVTGRFFFGKRFAKQKLRGLPITTGLQHLLNDLIKEFFQPSTILFGTKLLKANVLPRHKKLNKDVVDLRNTCSEMIRETELERNQDNSKKENNLLGLLLDMRETDNLEDRLTNEQVTGEFIGLFMGGTDTTSHLVNSALYFLWKNPEMLTKVREEVDREFNDLKTLNIEGINRMDYTTAFLKETLRLGGPVSCLFTRTASKDDDLCGIKIKKGTHVDVNPGMCFTSDEYYVNPTEFNPERWLNNNSKNLNAYAYLPFSAGPRNCIGQHLAMIEARILLALFIKTFKFEFAKDSDFTLVQRFTFEPIKPLIVSLQKVE